jgi:uncharacterized repeat protein (TIGR03806 family)
MRGWIFLIVLMFAFLTFAFETNTFVRKDKLSEYNFFQQPLADLHPAKDVIPYDVNTPLFSNYAEKARFLKIPDGTTVIYNDTSVLDFPQGSILIKNFYFPVDFRNPSKGRKILETRLLVHEESGWQAYPYIWNEDQTDAFYDPAGETRTITYTNLSGKKVSTPYAIPNKNQCKGCHINNNKLLPIGVSARQLNRNYQFETGEANQLQNLLDHQKLDTLPSEIPRLAVWNKPETGTLNDRARAYLDSNCAHCHSRFGPANTSGLYLDYRETDPAHLGVMKSPVAAGRGAGNLQFDIKPGEPQNSIMIFRMKTNDPAIAMPEIGREQVHQEAVALLEEWIRKNSF